MSVLVRDVGPWKQGELTLTLADFAAHTMPVGAGGDTYFLPFLGLEFNAAPNDVPFRLGPQSRPIALGVLSIWGDGADEPAPCAATLSVLVNGAPVPGLSVAVDLNALAGTGTHNAIAAPPLPLALNDQVSVRIEVADPSTGVPLQLFARVSVFV